MASTKQEPRYRRVRSAPRNHTARVASELGRAIVSGHHAPNVVLPPYTELMEGFGVSRTVLREAMKTLAGKGLLQAKARAGTKVRDSADWNLFDADVLTWYAENGFDAPFLAHLSEMRLCLEPEAAALAAVRHTPAQLADLNHWVDRMGARGVTAPKFVDADLNFHLAVAAAAANPFFNAISTLIEVALVAALARRSPVDDAEDLKASVKRHKAVADAIGRHDSEAAREAMRQVINYYPAEMPVAKGRRARRHHRKD